MALGDFTADDHPLTKIAKGFEWNRQQLAEHIGYSSGQLSRCLRDEAGFSRARAARIVKALERHGVTNLSPPMLLFPQEYIDWLPQFKQDAA